MASNAVATSSFSGTTRWHQTRQPTCNYQAAPLQDRACSCASQLLPVLSLLLSMTVLQSLRAHEGQRLLLGDAARLASSLADDQR